MRVRVLLILCAGLLISSCGGSSGDSVEPGTSPDGDYDAPIQSGSAIGPGISIEEATTSRLDGPLLVNGWLWQSGTEKPRLCSSLSESQVPQCAEPSLTITGIDLSKYALHRNANTAWSDQAVQLLGHVRGGTLTLAPLSR